MNLRGEKVLSRSDKLAAYYATHPRRQSDNAFYIVDCSCTLCHQERVRLGDQFKQEPTRQ